MKTRLVAYLLVGIWFAAGPAQAGEIESLLCRINAGTPFKTDKVKVFDTVARLMPPREVEADKPVVQREAVIEKRFSFTADYDPDRQEFRRIKSARVPAGQPGSPRDDLSAAVKLLLHDQCRSVQVLADSPNSNRGLKVWGTVTFDVEVAFERESRRPVFYQRSGAFAGSGEQAVQLSRQQILEIFEKRYKTVIPPPPDARLDEAWMADYPLNPEELIPVAEVWYRRKDQTGKDYVLFQFNPNSHELTLFERKWSDPQAASHGG